MACSRDKTTSAVAYLIGSVQGGNIYSELKPVYWIKEENRVGFVELNNGNRIECDLICYADATKSVKSIDYTTAVFINEMPTSLIKDGDYTIQHISDVNRGKITFYLKRKAVQYDSLFFNYNGQVVKFQCNFDKNNLVAYVPKNKILPFNEEDVVWSRKPTSVNDSKNRIKLISESIVGYDTLSAKFKKVVFENDNAV